MTYRPGSEMPGLAHSHVSQLAVSRLSPRAGLALGRNIASEDQVPLALAEAIVEKATGNPFFLEELTWSAVTERGHSASASVAGTVVDMLRARIDRLRQRAGGHPKPPRS
jgi:predicted ATPase